MSKVLPPWEVIPPWGKRAPGPVVQGVRLANLENTFIPPKTQAPPPEPVSAPSPPSHAHRKTISLPKNPRPVRPKVPSSPKPTDSSPPSISNTSPQSTKIPSPTGAAFPMPPLLLESDQITRTRGRSSTVSGTFACPPSSDSAASQPPLPLNALYPSPPPSTKSPILPQKQLEDIRDDVSLSSTKSLPPALERNVLTTIDTNNTAPLRKSRFNYQKESLSIKILTQNSNSHSSPSPLSATSRSSNPPTPDLPRKLVNTIWSPRSLTSEKKLPKHLDSPTYDEQIFAWMETKGSQDVALGDKEKDVAEYNTRTPRTPKALTLPALRADSKSSKAFSDQGTQRSRRLASPGYIKDKYSMTGLDGNPDVDVLLGGRSASIRVEDTKANIKSILKRSEDQTIPSPENLPIDMHDMCDAQNGTPSRKPPNPSRDEIAGPKLIPLKYNPLPSPKRAVTKSAGPPVPKLIPLKLASPPTPEDSEDESFTYQHEPVEDLVSHITLEVAPLRLKSNENSPTLKITPNTRSTTSSPKPRTPKSTTELPSSLTSYLISRFAPQKLYNATHSSFLHHCSNGKISLRLLSKYLTQERIFLHYYLRFLALLLANVSIPPKPSHQSPNTAESGKDIIEARLTSHLITQLSHAQSQLSLFTSLSKDHADLDLETWEQVTEDGMSDATRMLVRLFDVIGSAVERGEKSMLVGLVILWARQKAHLESFKPLLNHTTLPSTHVLASLVPALSGPSSQSLTASLSRLLDDLFRHIYLDHSTAFTPLKRSKGKQSPTKRGELSWEAEAEEFEEILETVLDIQAGSWPDVWQVM